MIPLNNLPFFFIYIISGLFQGFLYGYFIHNYLEPKYGYKSFLYFYIGFVFYILITLFIIYNAPYFRILFTIFFLTVCAFILYNGKRLKKLLVGVLLFTISAVAEVFSQFIIIFIFQYNIFENLPNHLLIIVLIIANIILFILTKSLLKFTHNNFNFNNRFSNVFICLAINNLLISIVLSLGYCFNGLLNHYPETYTDRVILIIFICFAVTFALIIYIVYSIAKLKKETAKELIFQSIHQQNIIQLEKYLQSKQNVYNNSELRHDIMNYLQTMTTLKEENKYE